jgi:hypothetical protein
VEARATALSLHSFFFFMGQTVGPIAYGFGIKNVGKVPTLLTSAVVMIALGMACARLLRQTRPGRLMPAHKQVLINRGWAGGCHSMTVLERIAASGQPSRPTNRRYGAISWNEMRPPTEAASSEWPEVKITTHGHDAANHNGGRGLRPNRNDGHDRRAPYGRDHDLP